MKIERQKVYDKYKGHCAYCGNEIPFKDMQIDHVYPRNFDNLHEWSEELKSQRPADINSYDNLMPSCRKCNFYKGTHLLEHFREVMKTLHEKNEKIFIVKLAIKYGIVKITPFDGLFYFEKYPELKANKEKFDKWWDEQSDMFYNE
jgi:hypothetical protein